MIATCECRKNCIQTEVIYSEEAEGFVCFYCGYYPVYVPKPVVSSAASPSTHNVRDFVEYWSSEHALDDYSFVFGKGVQRE